MTFTEIQYFVDAAECLSFTKAAEKNYVAQQVVSKQIKKLEDELGYQLFDRSNNQLKLSEAGKLLFPFWKETLKKQDKMLKKAATIFDKDNQDIRVGCLYISSLYDMVSEAIAEVSGKGCLKHFQVDNGTCKDLYQRLVDGEVDCIISLSDETRTLPDGFLEEQLDCWKPALIMSKNHPLCKNDLDIAEIKNTTVYMLSTKYAFNAEKNILKCCWHYGFVPENIRYFDDVSSMAMALYEGTGVTFMYPKAFRNPNGRLVQFPVDESIADSNFLTVAYNPDKKEVLSSFIDELKLHIHMGVEPIAKSC